MVDLPPYRSHPRRQIGEAPFISTSLRRPVGVSPVLPERLRSWWRVARAQGEMSPNGWLFPGLNPMDPLSTRQLDRAIHAAAEAAQIDKRVSMHTPRHSFATHLLEQKATSA